MSRQGMDQEKRLEKSANFGGSKICRFFQPFFLIHPLPIHYPLRIRIHYESIIHYVSVYSSIIHHVSSSIILSRLRIHLEAPGRHFGDFVPTLPTLPTFWRFCADIADMLVILCRHCELLCVYCLFMVCCEISSVNSICPGTPRLPLILSTAYFGTTWLGPCA